MSVELILFIIILILTPYLIILMFISTPPYSILDYLLYKKYKKAKKEWNYITSTKLGMNKSRWILILIFEIAFIFLGVLFLIDLNNIHTFRILSDLLIGSLFISSFIYDKLNPASGTVEIYKEGIAVYIKIFNTLKPFLNYYMVFPWKFFRGYKVKYRNKKKYIVLIPKSKLFFNIYLKDNDGNIEKTIKNYLNPTQ